MRRLWVLIAALLVAAACSSDDGGGLDLGDLEGGTLPGDTQPDDTQPGGTLPQGTITLPSEDGSDITVSTGGGSGVVQVGDDIYEYTINQCIFTDEGAFFDGEGDGIVIASAAGIGLSVVVNPNGDSVSYVVSLPDMEVSGNQVTGGGEASGFTATGIGDPVQITVIATC